MACDSLNATSLGEGMGDALADKCAAPADRSIDARGEASVWGAMPMTDGGAEIDPADGCVAATPS